MWAAVQCSKLIALLEAAGRPGIWRATGASVPGGWGVPATPATFEVAAPRSEPLTTEVGAGPYRLYTLIVRALRARDVTRSQLERLRREMFAPGADFLEVAARGVTLDTGKEEQKPLFIAHKIGK
jgi:hypothetical protein